METLGPSRKGLKVRGCSNVSVGMHLVEWTAVARRALPDTPKTSPTPLPARLAFLSFSHLVKARPQWPTSRSFVLPPVHPLASPASLASRVLPS